MYSGKVRCTLRGERVPFTIEYFTKSMLAKGPYNKKLACRKCTPNVVTDAKCHGACGEWKEIEEFSGCARSNEGPVCDKCTAWKEEVPRELAAVPHAPPAMAVARDEEDNFEIADDHLLGREVKDPSRIPDDMKELGKQLGSMSGIHSDDEDGPKLPGAFKPKKKRGASKAFRLRSNASSVSGASSSSRGPSKPASVAASTQKLTIDYGAGPEKMREIARLAQQNQKCKSTAGSGAWSRGPPTQTAISAMTKTVGAPSETTEKVNAAGKANATFSAFGKTTVTEQGDNSADEDGYVPPSEPLELKGTGWAKVGTNKGRTARYQNMTKHHEHNDAWSGDESEEEITIKSTKFRN